MRLRSPSAFLVLAALSIVVFAVPAATSAGATETQTYIVQFLEKPVVAYDGGVAGLPATKPGKGRKVDPDASDVVRYAGRLKGKHDDALAAVGGGRKLYDYVYSFNGLAAKLTETQAAALAKVDGVLAVTPDELRTVDTSSTPGFLGLDAPGGLWEQLGGNGSKKADGAGEDIVIGVVDSGIWPESASFSDRDEKGKLAYQKLKGWKAKCAKGEEFKGSDCNKKLIGAQYFNESWGGNAGIEAQRPWEFTSPRDYNGHGSHTASTAGGNFGVQATGPASVFGKISGMAPRARIAAYKALWSTQDAAQASGFTGDLVAAIDQAVADGVDVINYSVSGTQSNFLDPAQVAFLFAADAGIFVAASAGNNGPATGTVAHPSPWITTVAAGTHNRDGQGSVTLGNGATYPGASVATPVGPAPLVDSVDAGKAGANATDVQLCTPGTLDPAKVTGTIVICLRGVIARVDKSRAVQEAGGVGMVMYNDPDSSLNADFHFVPSVHVNRAGGLAIKAYAATPNPTATINASTLIFDAPAPFTASFSSRGPSPAAGGDVLKPDVIAPGQDVLAAVAPPGNAGRDFNLYSGTSMSSPHVAGLAALLKQRHPDWSPMAVKSALMTTGYDVLDGGTPAPSTNPVLIFRQGAGHVQPNKAADPGLVYDSDLLDWLAFLCGSTSGVNPATCATLQGAGYSFDASDMNVPSIAIGDLAGIQTVKRRVTNVGGSQATYAASVTGSGFSAVVSPSSLTLAPGETKSFTVTFTRTTAGLNAYVGGQLTWTDGTHSVRSPIVLRPVALAAPAQVSGTGPDVSYGVRFGYTGSFTADGRGLVPAVTESRTVLDDPTDSTCSLSSPNAQKHDIAVPAGTTYARFSLFDDFTDGNDDLDMCVFRGTTQVGASGSGTSAEEVNLVDPAAATYTVVVQGWGTDGPDAQYTLFHWLLGSTSAGNMTVVAPATAALGGPGTVSLSFSGLAPATRYLGSVAYGGSTGMPNPTIVRVDTP
jgi:subtilisin family serine protease